MIKTSGVKSVKPVNTHFTPHCSSATIACKRRRIAFCSSLRWEATGRKLIGIPEEYSKYRDVFIDMLLLLHPMLDEHVGYILTVKHQYSLEYLTICTVRSVPYCAMPMTRDIDRSGTGNMLEMNANDPNQTEWASAVDFGQAKTELQGFLLIAENALP